MTDFHELLAANNNILNQWQISPEQQERLAVWLAFVWEQNSELNLFSRKMESKALVEEHLLDSLAGLPHLPECSVIADLGTGGGFPAIPLAICRPQTRFLLFEKSVLKSRYLQRVDLPNIQPSGALDPESLSEEVDLVIARAFKPIKVILDMTRQYHKRGGRYMLYKGRRQKVDEELREARLPEGRFNVSNLETYGKIEERCLVWIQ